MCSNRRGHCRLTGHWFMRSVRPLFMASPNLTALNSGPYAPITEMVPPLRTESIAQLSATGDPACAHEPGAFRGVEPDRTGAEHHDDVALDDVAELRPEVPGRESVGQQDG